MNILILTSVYPGNYRGGKDSNVTQVVHYFAKEWMREGHNVKVIHNSNRYPLFVHMLPRKVKNYFLSRNSYPIPDIDYAKKEEYEWEGISVVRLPMLKLIPHGDHPRVVIQKQFRLIEKHLVGFKPDIIIGHWSTPQIQLIKLLKEKYHCRTALTLHGISYITSQKFDFQKYMDGIDRFGVRNAYDAKKVRELLNLNYCPYICYSGIPDEYIENNQSSIEKFKTVSTLKLLFVGRLVERKNVQTVLEALYRLGLKNYEFDIIGDGPYKEQLEDYCSSLGLSDYVHFVGRIPRDEVMKYSKDAHYFVMVSRDEAYGLVYLEAMANHCIPIGAINEGGDGIIQDRVNGYLCKAGDVSELENVFEEIMDTKESETIEMANNAFNRATELTDSKAARLYLENAMQ